MGLPDPKQFNFKLLLQRFQKKYGDEITRELLSQFLVDGTIKGDPVREKYQRGGGFVRSWGETRREPVYYVDGPVIDYIIPLDEVLRFEAEHPPAGQAAAESMTEADIKEFVAEQRAAGVDDAVTARELQKKKTPQGRALSKEKIGRALHPAPEAITSNSTFTKHADKLLKDTE